MRLPCEILTFAVYFSSRYFVDSGNGLAGQIEGVTKPAADQSAQAAFSPLQTAFSSDSGLLGNGFMPVLEPPTPPLPQSTKYRLRYFVDSGKNVPGNSKTW